MSKRHRSSRSKVSSGFVESLERRQLLAVIVDVRLLGAPAGSGKSVTVGENGTFTVGVYLKNINSASTVSADANNGLGSFGFALRTTGEKYKSGSAWPVAATPTDTVVNATASKNMTSASVFDIGYSDGVIKDINAMLPLQNLPNNDTDTDIDATGISGTQYDTGSPAYQTGIGINSEVLLGTVTYKALDLSDSTRGFNRTAQINAYYTAATGAYGGLVIKGLQSNKTDGTNQVSGTNLITSASNIGSPVTVTVTGSNPPPTTTGSISGTVFSDADKDGVLDVGESKLASRRIYIDGNANGKFDSGEKSVLSNSSGVYTFTGLAAGTYRISRADLPTGYYVSTGSGGFSTVNLASGQNVSNINIGAATGTVQPPPTTTGSISGTVFSDADKDGVLDTGESKLASRRIYIDANSNGKFDSGEKSVFSNGSGVYTITGLTAGTYRVGRADLPTGYYISTGSGGFSTVTLGSGQNVSGINIGAATGTVQPPTTTGSISGTVFSDADKDGVLDATETKLANRKMYIDTNKNGKLDAGEKVVYSNASGVYTFTGLAAGTYRVRRGDLPPGYYLTTPASGYYDVTVTGGGSVTNKNFGAA